MRKSLILLMFLAWSPAQAQMKEAALYAHCAGIADAAFGAALAIDDRDEMDYLADESHMFMVLARRHRDGVSMGTLQQFRVEGAAELFREGATDDSIHTLVQECSDLRQALTRDGAWHDDAAR